MGSPEAFDYFERAVKLSTTQKPLRSAAEQLELFAQYETEQDHYGFIGGRQLDVVDELLAPHRERASIRVAVFHHYLHPYRSKLAQSMQTVRSDLSRCLRWLLEPTL